MAYSPCDGWMTGTDPNVNVTVCGVGRSRTKSLTLICIYGECNAILPFTFRKKSRLLFCFRDTFARMSRQMACFSIKLEQQSGLVFFSRMHFVRILGVSLTPAGRLDYQPLFGEDPCKERKLCVK